MRTRTIASVVVLPALLWIGTAKAMPLIQEMGLHSMLESTTSAFTTLRDYAVLDPDGISDNTGNIGGGPVTWSGTFGSAAWRYEAAGVFSGMALAMNFTGILTGSGNSDLVVHISGSGMLGDQPLLITASATWYYDATVQDYLQMDFDQITKIGANSWYGRVTGKEKIVCIVDGVVIGDGTLPPVIPSAPVELTSVASSGKKSRYPTANDYRPGTKLCQSAPVELTSVASTGKRGIATVSTIVVSVLSNGSAPARVLPAAIAPGHEFDPSNLGTVLATDGGMYADDARNQFRSTGQFLTDQSFSGTTISVPEPGSAWLTGFALAALLAVPRSRRVGSVLKQQLQTPPPAPPTTV